MISNGSSYETHANCDIVAIKCKAPFKVQWEFMVEGFPDPSLYWDVDDEFHYCTIYDHHHRRMVAVPVLQSDTGANVQIILWDYSSGDHP